MCLRCGPAAAARPWGAASAPAAGPALPYRPAPDEAPSTSAVSAASAVRERDVVAGRLRHVDRLLQRQQRLLRVWHRRQTATKVKLIFCALAGRTGSMDCMVMCTCAVGACRSAFGIWTEMKAVH